MLSGEYERKIAGSMREHKAFDCPLLLKSLDVDGRFAGYASVFGVVDNQRDIVMNGAFRQSIAERAGEIKLLWQHAQDEPIGYFTTMFEDEQGLYVEGQLMLELERGREAYALLKQGVVKGLSIGYSPVRYRLDPDNGVRQLQAVDLWEVSLVTFPANAQAGVTVVKSMTCDEDAEWQALDASIGRLLSVVSVSC
jgi:HK97 family phage prohead protease